MRRFDAQTLAYPDELPITARRDELLETIADNQVVIVAGETGSGKSTQLPKLCLELGRGVDARIGHTQPRRIAARSIAERIAEELTTEVGDVVGYTVRFNDRVREHTQVKLMTDGILLAEMQRDRRLRAYDTLIIDEAHERTLNIDFLLGYLRELLPRRPDLKVIITSATIDTERFSAHFGDAPIVSVSGRTYPVDLRYRPMVDELDDDEPIDQPTAICQAVEELVTEIDGDVLVFCSGEREIRDAVDALVDLALPDTEVVPLYARLSAAEQHRVFAPHDRRRIVVATNVAETSLTVPGIRAVVDPGMARISRYSRRTKVQRLPIEAVSRASADQRAGRCGRTGPGICIRLFTEEDYENRPAFTEPEIQRTNLASVILQMASLGLGDVERFPFVDPPDNRNIRDGIALLEELDAVNPDRQGRRGWLTPVGRRLAKLPIDPRLGRMLLAADENGCLSEVLIIAAALSIQDPRERPKEREEEARELHGRFVDPESDFIGFLHLWRHLREERAAGSSSRFRRLCRRELLNYPRVREWQDIHTQLSRSAKELGMRRNDSPADSDMIHQSLLAGLLSHVGTKDKDSFEYRGARNARFAIAPGSTFFKRGPRWLMAAELVETNRLWARVIARTRPEWIEAAAPHLVKRSYSDPHWDSERGSAVASESVTLYGLPLIGGRQVMWGRIDPADAQDLFIRHALVANEWDERHDFIEHNRARIDEVRALEARARRADLLIDDEALVDWFDHRIPDDISSVRHFNRWWKAARRDRPRLLHFEVADLLAGDPSAALDEDYPDCWRYGDLELPLSYEFDPASPTDGITIDIRASVLGRIDGSRFDWLVPGFRAELVTSLIRGLPKQLRKTFVPIPETATALLPRLDPAAGSIVDELRAALGAATGGVEIPTDAISLEQLPLHLRPNFRIVADDGGPIAMGGDLDALKALLEAQLRSSLRSSAHELEQHGVTSWEFDDIPRRVPTEGAGHEVTAFPAIVDEGESVGLRLLATAAEQHQAMWEGTRRLLLLNRPGVSRALRALLTNEVKLALIRSPYPSPSAWFDDLLACAVDQLMIDAGAPVWREADWLELVAYVKTALPSAVGSLGTTSAGILQQVADVEARLAELTAPKFAAATTDVRYQLDSLVYPGFLTGLGARNLPNLSRYLEAMDRRLQQLPEHSGRDADAMTRILALQRAHDALSDRLAGSAELEAVTWMLQELRVSLFAQSVGAKGQVSEKRVRRALDALENR